MSDARARMAGATLTLVSRGYCHLCDEMRAALAPLAAEFGARVVELDADADPELENRYGELVPVLLLGQPMTGVELCHYRLDRCRVAQALAPSGKPPAEA